MDNSKDNNLDLIVRNAVFYGNNLLYFIYKKGIKISKAIYLVTDIIKDAEPIKWSLRKAASGLAVVKDNEDMRRAGWGIAAKISSIKTLVLLANFSNNISDMNTSILVKECDDLHNLINELDSYSKQHLSLDKGFFGVEQLQTPSPFISSLVAEHTPAQAFDKGHLKDKNEGVSFKQSNLNKVKGFSQRGQQIELKDSNKTDRRTQIINIIKEKGEVTIKDISSLIQDCSEKTIQRELMSLLGQGQIKRTGDRRWSRYSVI